MVHLLQPTSNLIRFIHHKDMIKQKSSLMPARPAYIWNVITMTAVYNYREKERERWREIERDERDNRLGT